MNVRRYILPLLALLLAGASLEAQQPGTMRLNDVRFRWGFFGGYALNRHTADFRALPGVPNCCPQFESGEGTGFAGGLLFEIPLAPSILVGLRGSWGQHDGTLLRDEITTGISGNETIPVTFEHAVEGKLASAGLEPLLQFRPFGGLWLMGGGRLGYLYEHDFAQREEIVEPAVGATFTDGSKIRNEMNGTLDPSSPVQAWVGGGISYEIGGGDGGTIIAPEAFYFYPLTQLSPDVTWNVATLRFGLALKFTGPPRYIAKEIVIDTSIVRDTSTITVAWGEPERVIFVDSESETYDSEESSTIYRSVTVREKYRREIPSASAELTASLRVVGVTPDGREAESPTIRTEETLASEYRPLLNYVFFDSGSAVLPSRYRRLSSSATASFTPEGLYRDGTLDIYHHVLNVIGRRMTNRPEATITIVGCNNGAGLEENNLDLSRRRAETIRDYLRDVWMIDESRMSLESRNIPERPSNTSGETRSDGLAENRRAEIYSDVWEIVEPVLTTDTIRISSIDAIRFYPAASSRAGITSMELEVEGADGTVARWDDGTGALDRTIDWRIADDRDLLANLTGVYTASLGATDGSGATAEAAPQTFAVDQVTITKKRVERIADRVIDRYSLILFDFDKSTFSDANSRIVEFVRGRVAPESIVTITGHTDRTGSADYNLRLSTQRAEATAAALAHPNATAAGRGEENLLFDNTLPEGRFYCRTVNIVVETPVNE